MQHIESIHSIFLKYLNLFIDTGLVDTEDLKIEISELNLQEHTDIDATIASIEATFSEYISWKDRLETDDRDHVFVREKLLAIYEQIVTKFSKVIYG